jgi:hypothetical protein
VVVSGYAVVLGLDLLRLLFQAHEASVFLAYPTVQEENGGQQQQTLSERLKRRGVGLGQP